MSSSVTIDDIYKLFQASQQEYDRRAAEAALSMARLEKTVDFTTKAVEALTIRWGYFVAELVEPAVLRLFQEKEIDVKEVYPRARTKRQGFAMEIDILAIGNTELVLIELDIKTQKLALQHFALQC